MQFHDNQASANPGATRSDPASLLDEHALAFFEATATSRGIIEGHEKNTFGDQVRWGTPDGGEYDLAHIYLHAGDQQKSLAQFDAARDCQNMKALIGSGRRTSMTRSHAESRKVNRS